MQINLAITDALIFNSTALHMNPQYLVPFYLEIHL